MGAISRRILIAAVVACTGLSCFIAAADVRSARPCLVRVADLGRTDRDSEGLNDVFEVVSTKDLIDARTNGVKAVLLRDLYSDAVQYYFHDLGTKTIFEWRGGSDVLQAACDLGAHYIQTDRPEEAVAELSRLKARAAHPVAAAEFRIRDPFILADPATHTYYLYETASPYALPAYERGVDVRTSTDLVRWSPPARVMTVPPARHARSVWAPEVHFWNGKYWLFATVTEYPSERVRHELMAEDASYRMSELHRPGLRGVWVYASDSPQGPFRPVVDRAVTPDEWICLDGTLAVEDGRPHMIFCHEWLQTQFGRMDEAELSADLTRFVEKPKILFRAKASEIGLACNQVTDGCFIHRSKSGKLFMIWSSFVKENGYSVLLCESQSGRLAGPWTNHHVIYGRDGGHAMIFRTFDGKLKMALHGPNGRGMERLRLLSVDDTGDDLVVRE